MSRIDFRADHRSDRRRLARTVGAGFFLLLFLGQAIAEAQYYIYYKGSAVNQFGKRQEKPYATREEAEKERRRQAEATGGPSTYLSITYVDGTPMPGAGAAPTKSYTGNDPRMMFFGALLDFIFKPEDPAEREAAARRKEEARQRELARQEEERRIREEERRIREAELEAARNKAIGEWNELKSTEDANREREKAEGELRSAGLLDKIGAGTDPKASTLKLKTGTDFFGTGRPGEANLTVTERGQFPTAGFTALQSLQATADFFQDAVEAAGGGDYEKAVFLGAQADCVLQGKPTRLKSRFADLPPVPPPNDPQAPARKEEMKKLLRTFEKNVAAVKAAEIRMAEIDVQVKAGERAREAVRLQAREAQARAAASKPEEKGDAEALLKKLEEDARKADEELARAKQAGLDKARECEKLKGDLAGIGARLKELAK